MMNPFSIAIVSALLLASGVHSLSTQKHNFDRRECLGAFGKALVAAPFALTPTISNAIPTDDGQQGISAVTQSEIGQAFRRSVVRGAQVADKIDEKWERLSDSLRDESKCDENTGRRLYDNGKRKDGTSIGNPGLGSLCNPEELKPLNMDMKDTILASAVKSALVASGGGNADALTKAIQETKDLVRPSFERSIDNAASEDEKNRGLYKFELYYTLRAITNFLKGDKAAVRAFQLTWGSELVSIYAPSANRKDYRSPFPEKLEEFSDFDYKKDDLLDALGKITVTLDQFKTGGLLGFYEISIPFDDYGSVVTVAIDDYSSIGAEILLSDQKMMEGPMQAMAKFLLNDVKIKSSLDTFYIDPSTTRQDDYNPTQLLLSLNGLTKM